MYMLEPAKEVATVPTMLHDMSRTRIASDKHLHLFLAGLPSCKPWQRWCVADSGAFYMYQQDDKYVFNAEPTDSKVSGIDGLSIAIKSYGTFACSVAVRNGPGKQHYPLPITNVAFTLNNSR
eukprot:3935847-Rhodomonas_salina.1